MAKEMDTTQLLRLKKSRTYTGLAEFRSGLNSYLVYGIPAFGSYVLRMHKLLIFRLWCDCVHAIYVFIYLLFVCLCLFISCDKMYTVHRFCNNLSQVDRYAQFAREYCCS